MHSRIDFRTFTILLLPSLLWAGNAVVGRYAMGLVPPVTLNFLRWVLALIILVALSGWVLRKDSPLWRHWKRYAVLGLFGMSCYSALLYLALKNSTPTNVTLIGTSTPIFTLFIGALFYAQRITPRQLFGAALSMTGVFVVLSHGDVHQLAALRLMPGDVFTLLSVIVWAWYGWLVAGTTEPPAIRNDWSAFLLAQAIFGTIWAGLLSAGEVVFTPTHFQWGWPLVLILVYVAVAPTILAFRFWALGVERVGPTVAGFCGNLSPLFTALLSAAFLGEPPKGYHGLAFVLIVVGILLSTGFAFGARAAAAAR